MLFCLKNFIFKKWVFKFFIALALICCKTHFLLFYFLKGIGVNFTLDPQKKGFKKRKGSKETP